MPNRLTSDAVWSAGIRLDVSVQSPASAAFRQISEVVEQVRRVTHEADALVSTRGHVDLSDRMHSDSWSIAQCLDHIAQTTQTSLPALQSALEKAPQLKEDRRLRIGIIGRMLILNLEPPYHLRFKVFPQLAPRNGEFEPAWKRFAESQRQVCETVLTGTGLALDEVEIQSPLCTRLRYNAYAALCILAAHQRRHLWQMRQIVKALSRRRHAAA